MCFNPEAVATWRRKKSQPTPGWHEVEVTDCYPYGGNQVFELKGDPEWWAEARFSRRNSDLWSPLLYSFVIATMNWDPVQHQGPSLRIARKEIYRKLIGRRVLVFLEVDKWGKARAQAWRPVLSPSPPSDSAPNDETNAGGDADDGTDPN